jgi:hypothetical protein
MILRISCIERFLKGEIRLPGQTFLVLAAVVVRGKVAEVDAGCLDLP